MRYTVNASIMLTELPVLERPAAVARAGFSDVEFWWPFPTETPSETEIAGFARALEDANVQLTGLNFYAGDMPAGERGVLSHPERTDEFRRGVDSLVTVARATGCRAFNALYGNRLPDVPVAEQDDAAVENLRYATDAVAAFGGTVLVEPLSGTPAYPLRTAADVVAVVARVDRPNVKLLADFYHLAVNGEDVEALIDQHAADFGHIQLADAPGRHEPGHGRAAPAPVGGPGPRVRLRRTGGAGVRPLPGRPVRVAPPRPASVRPRACSARRRRTGSPGVAGRLADGHAGRALLERMSSDQVQSERLPPGRRRAGMVPEQDIRRRRTPCASSWHRTSSRGR
ncbi:Hydroxypyruvate isomerase [Kocuria varians]|uniref:Hydroxypyruvate isomerase n=1 Tax=Kocuria varians TaxID=1272 RepID=A0A7D7L094_KOCVA|nr:Hydroxypyruvate isomerase [Kocuria varians]